MVIREFLLDDIFKDWNEEDPLTCPTRMTRKSRELQDLVLSTLRRWETEDEMEGGPRYAFS